MLTGSDNGASGTIRAARRRLEGAYRATLYRVQAPGGAVDLRVGSRSTRLDALLAVRGAHRWVWITACNPASRRLPRAGNERRTRRLLVDLRGAGSPGLPAAAVPIGGDWPVEQGVLVPGLGVAQGLALARRYGQNAIVCGRRGGVVRLVWV